MSRGVLVALVVLVLAAVLVGWGAVRAMRDSREDLERQFEQGELLRAEEVARGLAEDLNEIGDHLRFLAPLLSSTESASDVTRELRALFGVAHEIREAVVLDAAGHVQLTLDANGEPTLPGPLSTALTALPAPHIATSRPLATDPSGWLRAFSLAFGDAQSRRRGTVILVVDVGKMARLGGLRASAVRALVLDPTFAPSPASDATLAEAARLGTLRSMQTLLEDAHRERGATQITAADATKLGLPSSGAVAAHVLAAPRDAAPWTVVTVRSTASLRQHEREVLWKLGLAGTGIALCLVGFASYVVVASRRAVAMREQLRHADALAHLHDKTEKILDSIPALVVTLSREGRISALNRRARESLAEGAIGGDLHAALPEAPAAVVVDLEAQVAMAQREGTAQSLFGVRLALFGEEGSYNVHAMPLLARTLDESMLLVLEDVSKVQSLESQLVRAEKLATVGVLAAGIAHEIGTPLSVVRGRAEYIQGKLGDDHPQRAGLEVIGREIERVVTSVRQLLDFSRVRPAEVAPVELSGVATIVRELLGYEAQRRGLHLTVDVPADLPPLLADADQLQQVLINLVMNAFDACTDGGRVAVTARARGNRRVEISISDDGAGIEDAHRLQVFDPFFTTKKRGQGTGLGLAICAEIARHHGAEIELQPGPTRGTVALVSWPVARIAPENA